MRRSFFRVDVPAWFDGGWRRACGVTTTRAAPCTGGAGDGDALSLPVPVVVLSPRRWLLTRLLLSKAPLTARAAWSRNGRGSSISGHPCVSAKRRMISRWHANRPTSSRRADANTWRTEDEMPLLLETGDGRNGGWSGV